MDLKFYLSIFLRRVHYVVLLAILGGTVGGTAAVLLPPVYYAQATLVVEPEQIPGELAASTVRIGAAEQLQVIQQRILTRENLLDMANRLNVYAPRPGQAPVRMAADAIVGDMRRRISIVTSGGSGSRREAPSATLVTVSFTAPTAQLAASVVNEVVTLILSENVEIRTQTADQTLDFFTQEVDRLDQELKSKGAAIQAFQEANHDALPDSLEFRRSQLVAEQERLVGLQRDEAALRDRRQQLVQIYESTGNVAAVAAPAEPTTPEERQLLDLRNQLTSAQAVLSPTNPRVRLLQGQIAALEAQVAASRGVTPVDAPNSANSAYELQLADLDAQIQALGQQRSQIEANMAELQTTIDATPRNGISLDELQRDYDNTRAQYDQAVQRRAVAQTGQMIETLSKGQRISVIEQAIPPASPVSPNRPIIAAGGLGGGLFLGLALVALLEFSDRSIRRPIELTNRLGIQPFAALPLIRTAYDVRRRRLRIIAALVVILFLIPGSLWIIHSQIVPLDRVADHVLEQLANRFAAIEDMLG
ncbi:GumC family protein [Rubellimicrobium arenae]|uniref:GumC family protein n=1 Tax=Rubellimicrobium arenae TaxID=2817372 RepID=UPI001B30BC1F|nr:lipopolysaccharide biosynthesis protein [Rubellimicrobium arenae]